MSKINKGKLKFWYFIKKMWEGTVKKVILVIFFKLKKIWGKKWGKIYQKRTPIWN